VEPAAAAGPKLSATAVPAEKSKGHALDAHCAAPSGVLEGEKSAASSGLSSTASAPAGPGPVSYSSLGRGIMTDVTAAPAARLTEMVPVGQVSAGGVKSSVQSTPP
jgi:hypothetical protein